MVTCKTNIDTNGNQTGLGLAFKRKDGDTMQDKFLRRPEVVKMVGLSSTTIWRLEQTESFPARRKLSTGAVGWLESEVLAWMAERVKVG